MARADREMLARQHQAFSGAPFAIVLQCLVALVVGTWAIVSCLGELKPIRLGGGGFPCAPPRRPPRAAARGADSQRGASLGRNLDYFLDRTAFMRFDHRGFR